MADWLQLAIQFAVFLLGVAMVVSGYRNSEDDREITLGAVGWAILFFVGLVVIVADLIWTMISILTR